MRAVRVAVAVAVVLSVATLSAQRSNLRLGTILPATSVWDRSLKEMAAAWREGTEGRVRVQVRGTAGDESTIIRRMRMNKSAGCRPHASRPDVDRRRVQCLRHSVLLRVGRGGRARAQDADAAVA